MSIEFNETVNENDCVRIYPYFDQCIWDATGIYPDYYQGKKTDHSIKILICSISHKYNAIIADQIYGRKDLPNGTIVFNHPFISKIYIRHQSNDTSTIYFMSFNDKYKIVGMQYDYILVDCHEEPPEELMNELYLRSKDVKRIKMLKEL